MYGGHGGDIYRNRVELDFSVSVNPLGMPETVRDALREALEHCREYPDALQQELKRSVGGMLGTPGEWLIFGNGASELFMAIVHGLRPRKILIPIPSFYGYEYAAAASGGSVIFHRLLEEEGFACGERLLSLIGQKPDLVFLANPNNPTGKLMEDAYLERLLESCRENGVYVALDECFVEFCEGDHSALGRLAEFDNLVLVRAFTKIFAIPGVRLGYAVCADGALRERVARHLPEWNLSVFAQRAGCACAGQKEFVQSTAARVREEREFLREGLERAGIRVLSGEADFLFVHSEKPLYEPLLAQGVLIRDCGNFRGLGRGYYRIAVKNRAENEILIRKLREME